MSWTKYRFEVEILQLWRRGLGLLETRVKRYEASCDILGWRSSFTVQAQAHCWTRTTLTQCWNGPRPETVGPGSMLGPQYISLKPKKSLDPICSIARRLDCIDCYKLSYIILAIMQGLRAKFRKPEPDPSPKHKARFQLYAQLRSKPCKTGYSFILIT